LAAFLLSFAVVDFNELARPTGKRFISNEDEPGGDWWPSCSRAAGARDGQRAQFLEAGA
jgi:hypothetical protein